MTEYMTCPKCGGQAYAEGVDVGVGFYFPPFHCDCGWSEDCSFADKEACKTCTEYQYCYEKLNS